MLYSRLGFKKIKMRVVYLAGLLWKSEWKRIRTGIFRAVIVILSKKKYTANPLISTVMATVRMIRVFFF